MYNIKKQIYLTLDKTQKSSICNYIRALVKQNLDKDAETILNKFCEDEKYYLDLNTSRFMFLKSIIDDENFINDTFLYIKECKKYYEYKESQRPIIEKQKEFEKQKRQFLQQVKMSKEKPSKKQIYYYNNLCKKYNIEKLNVEELSKLDMKNEIGRIIDEHSRDCYNIDQ